MVYQTVLSGLLTTICHSPFSSYWNLKAYYHDCYNEAPMLLSYSVITAVLDFFVWVLPLPALFNTSLPLSQRLALVTLFSFGLIVVIASCIRIYYVDYVLNRTYDVTWYGFTLWIWTAVEVQLGLICGCVPWLKSLFKFWRTGETVAGTSGRGASSGQRVTGASKSSRTTGVRMESLGKSSAKGEYIDLERNSAGGDSATELNNPTQW